MPDTAWLGIRLMDTPSVAAVRDAIAAVTASRPPTEGVQLNADQVHELAALLNILSAWAAGRGGRDVARRADAFLSTLSTASPPGPDSTSANSR